MIDFFLTITEHFSDPRKRIFLGYIVLSIIIALIWLLTKRKLSLKDALKYVFNKSILFSKSSRSDFKLFFLNRIFLMFVSPLLITQLAIATVVYHFLDSIYWLDFGMFVEMNFLQPINTSENYSIIAIEGFRNEIRGLL